MCPYEEAFPGFYRKQGMIMATNPFKRPIDSDKFKEGLKETEVSLEKAKQVLDSYKELRPVLKTRVWKLLQFEEDLRPPYFGTFGKKSKIVNGRRPFTKDSENLDYDYDSEAEWVDEESGEELGSEDEMSEEEAGAAAEEEEEEDGWLVPHGYLSDDEGLTPEQRAKKEKDEAMKEEKEKQKKRVIEPLQPVIIGPIFSMEPTTDEDGALAGHGWQFILGQNLLLVVHNISN